MMTSTTHQNDSTDQLDIFHAWKMQVCVSLC